MPTAARRIHSWFVGLAGALLLRLLGATWKVRLHDPDGVFQPHSRGASRVIGAFWHRHILAILGQRPTRRVCVPISEHQDGEYAAQLARRFGVRAVRGSTTRGAVRLLKALLAAADEGWSLAITPDGPRGPRFTVQPGISLLARRSGLPVYPIGVAARPALVVRSWDRFVVPMPGARVAVFVGKPLRAARSAQTHLFCNALKEGLMAAERSAERLLDARP